MYYRRVRTAKGLPAGGATMVAPLFSADKVEFFPRRGIIKSGGSWKEQRQESVCIDRDRGESKWHQDQGAWEKPSVMDAAIITTSNRNGITIAQFARTLCGRGGNHTEHICRIKVK